MQARFAVIALLGFVLVAAAACSSGGDDAKLTELEERVEAAEEKAAEAEKKAEEEEAARKKAEEEAAEAEKKRKAAEDEAKKVEQAEKDAEEAEKRAEKAEQEAEQARQEAQRRIEEAEKQANVAVRAPLLIAELSGLAASDVFASGGVDYMPGGKLTFKRPLNLPAKGSAPSVPGSWRSASYSGPRGNVGTDTVYLYTNIQAPGSKAFWKVHGESVAITAGDFKTKAKPSGFTTTAKKLFPDENGSPVTKDKASRGGTYDGYSGAFKCATGCNIEAADDGALTFTGEWTFTASLTAKRTSKQAEQDTEFLYFGIWAYEPTNAATTPVFQWAAGGDTNEGAARISNFGDLTGTAEFTGGAIGKYALAKVGGRAAKIGTFTATANFSATFGVSPTISGRITDFKEGGSSLGADWNVFLGSSASEAATLAASGATGTRTTHGAIDGDTAEGTWAATLHGSDNEVLIDRTKYPVSKYPVADVAGVAGWFKAAAGTNAAIGGAFGAACTTGTMCAK